MSSVSVLSDSLPTIEQQLKQWSAFLWRRATYIAACVKVESVDVYQQFVLEAVKQYPKYDPDRGAFSTWLSLTMRNVIQGSFSQQGNRRLKLKPSSNSFRGEVWTDRDTDTEEDDEGEFGGVVVVDDRPPPDENAASQDSAEWVRGVLANLPERDRELLTRRYAGTGAISRAEGRRIPRILAGIQGGLRNLADSDDERGPASDLRLLECKSNASGYRNVYLSAKGIRGFSRYVAKVKLCGRLLTLPGSRSYFPHVTAQAVLRWYEATFGERWREVIKRDRRRNPWRVWWSEQYQGWLLAVWVKGERTEVTRLRKDGRPGKQLHVFASQAKARRHIRKWLRLRYGECARSVMYCAE